VIVKFLAVVELVAEGAATTEKVMVCVTSATNPFTSLTPNTTGVEAVTVVGEPLITPVLPVKVNPAGIDPETIYQVYGGVPYCVTPAVAKGMVYGNPDVCPTVKFLVTGADAMVNGLGKVAYEFIKIEDII
jgi:hypothetical protein